MCFRALPLLLAVTARSTGWSSRSTTPPLSTSLPKGTFPGSASSTRTCLNRRPQGYCCCRQAGGYRQSLPHTWRQALIIFVGCNARAGMFTLKQFQTMREKEVRTIKLHSRSFNHKISKFLPALSEVFVCLIGCLRSEGEADPSSLRFPRPHPQSRQDSLRLEGGQQE